MRFLIVTSAIFACAAASVVPYASLAPIAPVAHHLAPALPTISAGDIHGAYIDARVEATDHVRANYDATRQLQDKVNEIHGQAVNRAQEHAWREVDAVKTVEARLDGAAANAAPVLAKQIARSSPVVVAPASVVAAPAPVVAARAPVVAAPAPVITHTVAAPASAYAAPAPAYAALESAPAFYEQSFEPSFYNSYYPQEIEYAHAW